MKTKICSKCKIEKDITEFWKCKSNKDGLNYYCKKCHRKSAKEWRIKNSIKYWCYGTINGHKRRGYKILFTIKELFLIVKKITHCPICDTKLQFGGRENQKSATLDRINNEKILTLNNIQIICHKCNATKQDRTMPELVEWCNQFIKKYDKEFKI